MTFIKLICFYLFLGICVLGYNAKKRYKVHRDFNDNKEIKILNPEKIKAHFERCDEDRLLKIDLGHDILHFKNTLLFKVPKEHLNILYKNLKTLETKEKIFFLRFLLLKFIGGGYIPSQNKMMILKFVKKDVINHELFHVASTIYNKKNRNILCGFSQLDLRKRIRFGDGLNEGYTESLNNEYFKINTITSYSYQLCMFYAERVEEIVGNKLMLEAYLNADLPKLIRELKKYDTKENIIKFITNLDFILKYSDILYIPNFLFGKNKIYVEEKLKIRIKEIEETLTKWYLKKIQNDIKEKLITNEDALIDIKEFYDSITEHELLEKLNITNKNIEDYSEIKMIKKRYNH